MSRSDTGVKNDISFVLSNEHEANSKVLTAEFLPVMSYSWTRFSFSLKATDSKSLTEPMLLLPFYCLLENAVMPTLEVWQVQLRRLRSCFLDPWEHLFVQ